MEAKKRRHVVLDLEVNFAFFRSQHRRPVNAATHALLVDPILFTNHLIPHFLPLRSPSSRSTQPSPFPLSSTATPAPSLPRLPAMPLPRASASHFPGRSCWLRSSSVGPGLFEKRGLTWSDLPKILNKQFGYDPYLGFSKNVDKKMEADLRESRELKQRKIT